MRSISSKDSSVFARHNLRRKFSFVTSEAMRLYDLHFSGTGPAARAAFAEFLERAKLYNP